MIPESCARIAALLDANPVRGSGPFPIGAVVRGFDTELTVLRQAVADTPGPLGPTAPQLALSTGMVTWTWTVRWA